MECPIIFLSYTSSSDINGVFENKESKSDCCRFTVLGLSSMSVPDCLGFDGQKHSITEENMYELRKK